MKLDIQLLPTVHQIFFTLIQLCASIINCYCWKIPWIFMQNASVILALPWKLFFFHFSKFIFFCSSNKIWYFVQLCSQHFDSWIQKRWRFTDLVLFLNENVNDNFCFVLFHSICLKSILFWAFFCIETSYNSSNFK